MRYPNTLLKKADEGLDMLCENGTITLETIILKSPRPSFLINRAALGNLKVTFIALIGTAFSH